ncbi:hypothetical protein TanjilG_20326 [Lupinus angustifolius]|uniref:Uncharacterized protein n=1 Tax=Lupinus angustifolius TaxID=3871 RepID=A0A1J7FNF1_LUPAN|nr:PREDICTED: uncharacterized protein LOC109341105 [Lupinus angustifolius]OIV89515.1 hypothetical protein TanjilG_20326 [Lupinus angustifolius]
MSLTMSITYLLFFLCISLHTCNSRYLSTQDKKHEKKSHFPIKNEENNGVDFSQKQLRVMSEGNKMETGLVAQKPKKVRRTKHKVHKAMRKDPGALKSESLVSVSWRMPHKKPSDKNPGFNLDYAPPKTHPPSHN